MTACAYVRPVSNLARTTPHLNTGVSNKISNGRNATAEKLLVAASELMIERASIEISLSDIAQKSGVNAALVKYHFGNKDGLLLAFLARDAPPRWTISNISWASTSRRPRS